MLENLTDTQLALALVALVGGGYYLTKNPDTMGGLKENKLVPAAVVAALAYFYITQNKKSSEDKESFNVSKPKRRTKRSSRRNRIYENMENAEEPVAEAQTEESVAAAGTSNTRAPPADTPITSYDESADRESAPLATGPSSLDAKVTDRNINAMSDCPGGDCGKRLTSGDLLPSGESWGNTPSLGSVSEGLKTKNFLEAAHHFGVNTQSGSLRNANTQLRSDPYIPKIENLSPWMNSTIDADTNRRPLEIGNAC